MKVLGLWCILGAWLVLHAPAIQGEPPVEMEEEEEEEEEEEVIAEEAEEDLKGAPEGLLGQARTFLMDNYEDVEEPGDHCSRYSPKEVFHTHLHPHLLKILDEMSHFVESVLARVEASLPTLLLHVNHSPIGEARVEEVFPEVRRFMFGTMRDVYDVTRTAWRDVIHAHVRGHASPTDTLAAMTLVREAQQQGQARLVAALQEFSLTLKAVVLNSIHLVQESLGLAKDAKDHEAAAAIGRNLPKVAPNFLGTLMSLTLRRGIDPSGYKRILTDPFRSINPLVEQMYRTLETLVENGGNTEDMKDYWISAVSAAHQQLQESPLLQEDYEIIFRNEEYLAELVLQLMASF